MHGDPQEDGGLELLLELADSAMTYRGRYHAAPQLPRVLDLLLADDSNPRSILFQVVTIRAHLEDLPHTDDDLLTPDQRITTRLASDLQLADVFQLSDSVNRAGARARLDRLARQVEQNVNELSDRISQHFFSLSSAQRITGTGRHGSR